MKTTLAYVSTIGLLACSAPPPPETSPMETDVHAVREADLVTRPVEAGTTSEPTHPCDAVYATGSWIAGICCSESTTGTTGAIACAERSCDTVCHEQNGDMQACITSEGAEACVNACRGYTDGLLLGRACATAGTATPVSPAP